MEELSLFVAAFLGASLLPLSSEAAFVLALTNAMPLQTALLFASSGNILATLLNYGLGYFLYEKYHQKIDSSRFGRAAFTSAQRWGYGALLLSWLPIIGDPLTVAAGLLRLRLLTFFLIVASLRIARYWALSLMV